MKFKKLSALLLAGLMTASAVSFTEIIPRKNFTASATAVPIEYPDDTSGEVGENLTWSIDSEGTLNIDGEGNMDSDGIIYVGGAPWDYHYNNIKKIIIGDKVGTLVYSFITGYPNLTAIEVGENNKYHSSDNGILYNKDKSLLINCPEKNSIKEYTIPDSVKTIDERAFYFCQNLEEVTIPDRVTEIGYQAFYYCQNLTSVDFPENLEILGIEAFHNTPWFGTQNSVVYENGVLINGTKISDEKELPEGIRVIGGEAFSSNTKLTELTIPETVTHINEGIFFQNETLRSVTIPDNVIYLGESAFLQCFGLKEVTIGNGITEIKEMSFRLCESLNKVKIGENVKRIEDEAFWGCYDLTSIDIPENVEFIGDDVFEVNSLWEPPLKTITIRNPKCELSEYSIPEKTTIYGYKGSTAQEYAEKYNRAFIALKSDDTQSEPTLLGDANCDGKVSIADATAILQSLGNPDKYGLSEQGAANADIADTGNGVTPEDAVTIQRIDAKLE